MNVVLFNGKGINEGDCVVVVLCACVRDMDVPIRTAVPADAAKDHVFLQFPPRYRMYRRGRHTAVHNPGPSAFHIGSVDPLRRQTAYLWSATSFSKPCSKSCHPRRVWMGSNETREPITRPHHDPPVVNLAICIAAVHLPHTICGKSDTRDRVRPHRFANVHIARTIDRRICRGNNPNPVPPPPCSRPVGYPTPVQYDVP